MNWTYVVPAGAAIGVGLAAIYAADVTTGVIALLLAMCALLAYDVSRER